jgi:predicted transcriptional regulator
VKEWRMANYTIEHDLYDLSLCKKNRSYFEIIASILDAARDSDEDRYSLMKHTGFNYAQLKKYLESLTKMGFIEMYRKECRVAYRATAKGLDFLRQYYVLLGILLNAYTQSKKPQITCQAEQPSFNKSKNSDTYFISRFEKR